MTVGKYLSSAHSRMKLKSGRSYPASMNVESAMDSLKLIWCVLTVPVQNVFLNQQTVAADV